MKNKIKYLFLFLTSLTALSSCFPEEAEEALKYNGPTVVEFKNHTLGMVNNAPLGLDYRGILSTTGSTQTDSTRFVSIMGYSPSATRTVNPRTMDTVLVQLVGPQRSTATELNFEVMSTSTALEGTHYTLEPAGARMVTIPANSSVGRILIRPIAGGFTGTERKRLDLRLLGADNAAANKNYDTFYVTMTRTF